MKAPTKEKTKASAPEQKKAQNNKKKKKKATKKAGDQNAKGVGAKVEVCIWQPSFVAR